MLRKLPRRCGCTAEVTMAIAGTILPDISTMNSVSTTIATGRETGGRVVTNRMGTVESDATNVNTCNLP